MKKFIVVCTYVDGLRAVSQHQTRAEAERKAYEYNRETTLTNCEYFVLTRSKWENYIRWA